MLAVYATIAPVMAMAASPVLHFSDLNWGPKTGWEGSAVKGAAVTVWGQNLGSVRGTSYVTVNGAALTSDSDYAEWGVPGGARGLQRITFWLNPSCADGAGSISITVGGVTSNAIPFTVAPATIYFISASTGSNSNNGLYATAQGGSNGPFRDLYMFSFNHNPSGDGQYIAYVRGGTYTTQDIDNDMISYRGPSGGPTRQKALIAYPAETPVINASGLSRGVVWNADYSPYGRNSYLTYSKLTVANGVYAFYVYGDYVRVIGNHFQSMLDQGWVGVVHVSNSRYSSVYGNFFDHCGATLQGSYKHNVYVNTVPVSEIVSNTNADIGWNEFSDPEAGSDNRGGAVFARTDGSISSQYQTQNLYIHDNYFHGGTQNFVELGDGPPQHDIWIYNNIFTGGSAVNSPMSIRWTTANANLFNNTFYLAGSPSLPIVDVVGINPPGSNLHSANNIFYAAAGQSFFLVESGSTMTSDHDLFSQAGGGTALPSGSGLTLTNGRTGDPLFANTSAADFHLQSASPAIGAGAVLTAVTEDYDGVGRPRSLPYDNGAFQYSAGAPPAVSVTIAVSPTPVSLGGGQSRQFSATV
ncbi:MAG: hypothetical protein JST11_24140, partial [Acidobacteria bacterium]|nr:hypothetical protein [Acidobacteriota bacterium]